MYYTYVLKSTKIQWYYVGSTGDIHNRIKQHNNGKVFSTKARRPYTLIYSESFSSAGEARVREKEIKKNRKEKENIIKKYGPIV